VKDKKGDLLADSYSCILNRWKNYFSELLNVHNTSDVRQIEVHTTEPSLLPAIHKLVNFVFNKEELRDQWKESFIAPVHKKGDKTDCSNYRRISLLST
jgi:hypothetical protein